MVNIYIANIENLWLSSIASQPSENVAQIAFLWPWDDAFPDLQVGDIFAFRLRSPINRICGFAFFEESFRSHIYSVWDAFGRSTGADDLDDLKGRIQLMRTLQIAKNTTQTGVVLLSLPVFWPTTDWLQVPNSWPRNTRIGVMYPAAHPDVRHIQQQILPIPDLVTLEVLGGFSQESVPFGTSPESLRRLLQGRFRRRTLKIYKGRCALTDETALVAIEAVHLKPVSEKGSHHPNNSTLFRGDLHSIFDAGYAAISLEFRFVVSPKLRTVYRNSDVYYAMDGQKLRLPDDPANWPSLENLSWRLKHRFRK